MSPGLALGTGRANPVSRNMADTAAPQKNAWQRPFITRVRRRSPSSPAGGMSLASASRISPRVTRSQWQAISPYAGSAAIRSASW